MAREGIKQQREPSIGEEELDATRKEMETAREASKLGEMNGIPPALCLR